MDRYWVWEYGLFEKNPKRVDSLTPETTLEVVKLADAQATVEALQAIIKQMGEQACVLAKDGMAAKAQVEAAERHNTILQDANKVALEKVEALQRERDALKTEVYDQKKLAEK